jgi:hypothetical protein
VLTIAVITPSLPERGEMLGEAVESVRAQTLQPSVHAVGIDYARVGIGAMLNHLATGLQVEWLARLDDDDLFRPDHLELLASGVEDADVVYAWCEVAPRARDGQAPPAPEVLGRDGWTNHDFDPNRLRRRNYIPATAALVRKSLWEELGGWALGSWGIGESPREPEFAEDWDFWLRALDAGAQFLCIPEVTWTYRYHGENLWLK